MAGDRGHDLLEKVSGVGRRKGGIGLLLAQPDLATCDVVVGADLILGGVDTLSRGEVVEEVDARDGSSKVVRELDEDAAARVGGEEFPEPCGDLRGGLDAKDLSDYLTGGRESPALADAQPVWEDEGLKGRKSVLDALGGLNPAKMDRIHKISQTGQAVADPELAVKGEKLDKRGFRRVGGGVTTAAQEKLGLMAVLKEVVQPVVGGTGVTSGGGRDCTFMMKGGRDAVAEEVA